VNVKDMTTLDLVTLVCVLGCGMIAGLLYVFSVCVMQALGKLPPEQGIAAMQSINVVIINPWFLGVFFGTAVACLVLIAASLLRWHDPRAAYRLLGGVLYVAGVILVTMLFNVPRNDALAARAASSREAAEYWLTYLSSWTAWNHVRTLAALAAAVLFAIALRLRG
jgi:uncharacterized membrane protein